VRVIHGMNAGSHRPGAPPENRLKLPVRADGLANPDAM
jgi:hypothetical protein